MMKGRMRRKDKITLYSPDAMLVNCQAQNIQTTATHFMCVIWAIPGQINPDQLETQLPSEFYELHLEEELKPE